MITPKHRAALAAIDELRDGMVLGLGSGSTAELFIDALAEALREKKLREIVGVASSRKSEERAAQQGIRVVPIDQAPPIDITIDGADEIAPGLNLIKGLGGALMREKIVAQNSTKLVIVADASKLVSILGTRSALPIEVAPFGHLTHERFLRAFGCQPVLRKGADGNVFVTDNGNHIYDCKFERIDVPAVLDTSLRKRAGVLETGLFIGIAKLALIGYDDRVERLEG